MGVDDVYEFLKRNWTQTWLPSEIAEELGLSMQSVSLSLKVVSTYDDIVGEYLQKDLKVKKRGGWHYAYQPPINGGTNNG